jgi:hypothetical protein
LKLKKRIIIWLIVAIILTGLPIGVVAASQGIHSYSQVNDLDYDAKIDDQIVIIYQNEGTIKDLGLTTNQIEAGEKLNDQVDIIKVKDGSQADALVLELLKNPHVLAAQKNAYLKLASLPNDPMLSEAWQFEAIGADKTWDQVNNKESVVVAVLDTGLNTNHPDIIGKSVDGYDYVIGQTATSMRLAMALRSVAVLRRLPIMRLASPEWPASRILKSLHTGLGVKRSMITRSIWVMPVPPFIMRPIAPRCGRSI